ncbi:MAG: hypothetical protein KDJ16_00400 [Hyphomicrobiales bacterium]|nr:hypothetical protein [Hyphomicrobiales bacterium]
MKLDKEFQNELLAHVSEDELQALAMAYVYAVAYRARSELGDLRRLVERLFPDGSLATLGRALQPIADGQLGEAAKRLNLFAQQDRTRLPNLREHIALMASFDEA